MGSKDRWGSDEERISEWHEWERQADTGGKGGGISNKASLALPWWTFGAAAGAGVILDRVLS